MQSNLMRKALEHYAAEEWDAAGAALEAELAERPSNADAWYKLGNVRTEQDADQSASECFLKALALEPSHARSWNNLGAAHQRLGRDKQALDAYATALSLDPLLPEPYLNLGRLHVGRGELEQGADYFRTGLTHHPKDPMLGHLLAAANQDTPPRVPREHVVAYFDDFSAHFDAHLHALGYHVPQLMAASLVPLLRPGERVLDLGCGTGLVGRAIASRGARVDGVDLSPRMIERAREGGGYASLSVADIDEFLASREAGSYGVVLAADVFIYVGDLERTFAEAARVLRPGGLFLFSVESLAEGDFCLQTTGRFAHSLDYLARLAERSSLRQRETRAVVLRGENDGVADGHLVLLERL